MHSDVMIAVGMERTFLVAQLHFSHKSLFCCQYAWNGHHIIIHFTSSGHSKCIVICQESQQMSGCSVVVKCSNTMELEVHIVPKNYCSSWSQSWHSHCTKGGHCYHSCSNIHQILPLLLPCKTLLHTTLAQLNWPFVKFFVLHQMVRFWVRANFC